MQDLPYDPLRTKVIACATVIEEMQPLLPQGVTSETLDFGLHMIPNNLRKILQQVVDDQCVEFDTLILGYGLCAMAVVGLQTRNCTLVIPRVDDCIAIFLGSYAAYRREFDSTPGTYYLSKGWLESGSNPLSEYRKYEKRLGQEKAMWVMDQQYQHYKRLVLVAHTQEDLDQYRPQAQEVARFCERWGMRYEEVLGNDAFVRQLVEVAASLDRANEDFVVVPPGGELRQSDFIR